MNDSVWVHDLNPFLLRFSPALGVRWYGLAYLTGFVMGGVLMLFIAKRSRTTLTPRLIPHYIASVVVGTMLGGRLGYACFYSPELFTRLDTHFPYWSLLKVWEGGMASHGGIIGIMVAAGYFAWRHRLNWKHLADLSTLGGSIGIFFGRIANFINGELFGRAAPPSFPFRVKFPAEAYLWLEHDRHTGADQLRALTNATQVLAYPQEAWNSALLNVRSAEGTAQIRELIKSVIDSIDDGNTAIKAALAPQLTPRYPSQLIEALLEGAFLFVAAMLIWRRPQKPGVVGSTWLMGYASVRIFAEQFRMPDAQIGFELFGWTRGQWLSILTFFAALGFLIYSRAQKSPRLGGWAR